MKVLAVQASQVSHYFLLSVANVFLGALFWCTAYSCAFQNRDVNYEYKNKYHYERERVGAGGGGETCIDGKAAARTA
jgi:hypothetical protein